MVFKQKTSPATKNKTPIAAGKQKAKMFQFEEDDEDDFDDLDDDSEMESADDDMQVLKTPGQKTPVGKQTPKGKLTPAGKQTPASSIDRKVSFDLSGNKTPKGVINKRQATPGSKGKQGVQEFKGIKAGLNNSKNKSSPNDEEEDEEMDDESDDDDSDVNHKDLTSQPAKKEDRKALLQKKRLERDLRTLFVKNLPLGVTPEELKSLSTDILEVKVITKNKNKKQVFAFLEFANEEKAEENYKILKDTEFSGATLMVDYTGEKRQGEKLQGEKRQGGKREINPQDVFKRKLLISGIPVDATIDQIAKICPKAFLLIVSRPEEPRTARAEFRTLEEAEECLNACKNAKIGGKSITVVVATGPQKRTQAKQGGKRNAKKRRQDNVAQEVAEDEDDSDDDEE